MADTTNKPKLQLRSGVTANSDKSPSPATKLLLNHGKPNFTIQKSPKTQENGSGSPLSPLAQNNSNSNYYAYKSANGNTKSTSISSSSSSSTSTSSANNTVLKSTKFNGVFNASNVTVSEKQTHEKIFTTSSTENEASKVVLRRTVRAPEPVLREDEDASVPEFIRRQRRIQERLAKENVLDFESRRSGYFTHVVISPTATTSRTSFMETMASPAVVPSLEMPPSSKKEVAAEPPSRTPEVVEPQLKKVENGIATHEAHIGEEEEVARAIEEVNKAVAGEDDEHTTEVVHTAHSFEEQHTEHQSEVVAHTEHISSVHTVHTSEAVHTEHTREVVHSEHTSEVMHAVRTLEQLEENSTVAAASASAHVAPPVEEVTISHTNGAATQQHASGVLVLNCDDAHEYTGTDNVQVVHASPAIAVLKNGIDVASLDATEHASGALVSNLNTAAAPAAETSSATVQHASGALVNGAAGEPEPYAVHVQVVHVEESKPVELQNGIDASSIKAVPHTSGALVVDDNSTAAERLQDSDKSREN